MIVQTYILFQNQFNLQLFLMIITCDNCSSKKARKKKTCEIHSFIMKNTVSTVKYKSKVNINFCPILNKTTSIYENIFPHFNADGKSHLPAFTLPTDDSYFKNYEERYIKDHEKKIIQHECDKSELWEPKPNRKNKYCAVCKDNYEQYRDHIKQQNHKNYIMKNKYNNLINEMCVEIQKQNKKQNQYLLFDKISKYRILDNQVSPTTDESKITS